MLINHTPNPLSWRYYCLPDNISQFYGITVETALIWRKRDKIWRNVLFWTSINNEQGTINNEKRRKRNEEFTTEFKRSLHGVSRRGKRE